MKNLNILVVALLIGMSSFASAATLKLNELDSAIIYYSLESEGQFVELRADHTSIQTGSLLCKMNPLGMAVCQGQDSGFLGDGEEAVEIVKVLKRNGVPAYSDMAGTVLKTVTVSCTQTFFLHTAPDCELSY